MMHACAQVNVTVARHHESNKGTNAAIAMIPYDLPGDRCTALVLAGGDARSKTLP
jgi:hypothetical protein